MLRSLWMIFRQIGPEELLEPMRKLKGCSTSESCSFLGQIIPGEALLAWNYWYLDIFKEVGTLKKLRQDIRPLSPLDLTGRYACCFLRTLTDNIRHLGGCQNIMTSIFVLTQPKDPSKVFFVFPGIKKGLTHSNLPNMTKNNFKNSINLFLFCLLQFSACKRRCVELDVSAC